MNKITTPLTPRESEVLALSGKGYSDGRIARDLCLSRRAVQQHIRSIHDKLGITNRDDLIDYCRGYTEGRTASALDDPVRRDEAREMLADVLSDWRG